MRLPADATGTAQAGPGAVWVAVSLLGTYRVDTQTNRVSARVAVGTRDRRRAVSQIVLGENMVFAIGTSTSGGVLQDHNELARIDPVSAGLVRVTGLPSGPLVAAFGGGSLWLARPSSSAFDRIDPNTGTIVAHLRVSTTGPLAFSGGSVWIARAHGVLRSL